MGLCTCWKWKYALLITYYSLLSTKVIYMKFLIAFFLFYSTSVWAQSHLKCEYGKFNLMLELNKENDIQVDIFQGKTKVSACHLKVINYSDGKNTATLSELYRFKKSDCINIYDKLASQIEIISTGYIKNAINSKSFSAYILKNHQPLLCKTTQN